MRFGLKNAPATFRRAMDVILASVKWQHSLEYIDDIIILSETSECHLKNINEVLRLLVKNGFKIKLKKCNSYSKSFDYLEHVNAPKKLQGAWKTTEAVTSLQ